MDNIIDFEKMVARPIIWKRGYNIVTTRDYGFKVANQRGDRGRGSARTAEPRGPKFKIRGHSAPRSAARMPADVCRTLIKETISDDSAVYF